MRSDDTRVILYFILYYLAVLEILNPGPHIDQEKKYSYYRTTSLASGFITLKIIFIRKTKHRPVSAIHTYSFKCTCKCIFQKYSKTIA